MKDISYLKESGIDIDGALQLLGTVEMYNEKVLMKSLIILKYTKIIMILLIILF